MSVPKNRERVDILWSFSKLYKIWECNETDVSKIISIFIHDRYTNKDICAPFAEYGASISLII